MTEELRLRRLQRPQGKIDVVLDTDTYNEVDDQYALAYLIRSPEKLSLQAIYAAPFHNEKSDGPADGMEKSFHEIHHILELLGEAGYREVTFRGSARYLPSEEEAVDSPAARDLVQRGMARDEDHPLYVVAIGAITNVASALLLEPRLKDRLVVVWLGGNAYHWPNSQEFNMAQDVAAARVVFGCGVPVVQLPCRGVVSAFTTTGPELEAHLSSKNELCDYLVPMTAREARFQSAGGVWSRPLWDVTAVAWLLDGDFMLDRLEHSPLPQYDHHYSFDPTRHLCRYVYHIQRDALFADLFRKLSGV